MENKSFIIYSQKLAGWLMYHGFVLVDMSPDKKHYRRNVFFFKESPELHIAIEEYNSLK